MLKFHCVSSILVLLQLFDSNLAITTDTNADSVNEFQYCLRESTHPNLRECVGRTAINFLQRFDEKDNFTFADSVIAARDDNVASRSLVNFLDTDPVDFRGILENAGAVFSQRALEFHMDAIYPGLMFKIGPSADSNSVAQFMLDPTVDERNFNYEEPSTARILTKQYVLPFLLGLKFNLVALVPILFTVICLLLKKSLFIAKLVVYISSILGVGGIAGALGTFGGGLGGLFSGHSFGGGIPPQPPHGHAYGGANFGAVGGGVGGGLGVYPGKNTVYSQYEQDELQHISPYKRQDRKVVFEKTRENTGRVSGNNNNNHNVRSTPAPVVLATPATDRFYEYEKQVLMQDRSGKLRHSNSKLGLSAYDEDEEEVAGVINVAPSHRFKTSDNSGWKVVNLRTLDIAIANNDTWQFSDFLVIEKNAAASPSSTNKETHDKLQHLSNGRSLSDTLAVKMLQLARTRSLKLQLPTSINNFFNKRSISTALDDFNADANAVESGRKKKDKDKNMAMMGGMAMLAMVAQMFLGKVILIAGAAFVMAKVALLISVLGSLKKGSGGSGGGTDHVIVTGGGGGGSSGGHSHEHSSGWHRSMPYDYNKLEIVAADEHKFTEPVTYYEVAENDEFKRRNQYQLPPKQQNNLNKVHF
ncbi:uncharacterized protein LOC135952164 [Calliphora vicina]|uniref:uncharacterized protein LOC135952164 n=1 Tax=Calliphora vicina TaxID=7373 RepID=UPI00325B5BDF